MGSCSVVSLLLGGWSASVSMPLSGAAALAAASESVAAWSAMVRVRTMSPGVTGTVAAVVRFRFVAGVVSPVAG